MTIVQIEHPVRDYATWKVAFDRDPVGRQASGVRRYRIYRPVDDPNFVAIELEFNDLARAEAFKRSLEALWRSPQAAAALAGAPRARVVEVVDGEAY